MEFTWQYLATIGGAIAATVLITNVVARAFSWNPKWFGLAVALVIELVVWAFTLPTPQTFVLAVVNAFVIYAASIGGNQVMHAARLKSDRLELATQDANGDWRSFWQPWW